MVDLPKKKVGIVACSGEELPEGTITRLAALKVLEQLRPNDTVTICLPLFLAGGEGDRAFARFYPTIALDGCDKRCAARATEMFSSKPAASILVTDLIAENSPESLGSARRLSAAGLKTVDLTAEQTAALVDELLGKRWSRRTGELLETEDLIPLQVVEQPEPVEATCSCGSGIPMRKIVIEGQEVSLIALPLIFEQFLEANKMPCDDTAHALLETVKIYNSVPPEDEQAYASTLLREYATFCAEKEPAR